MTARHGTAPLDVGFSGGDNKNTVDVPGGASPAPWLVGPPDTTSRLVSADMGPNTSGISGTELRPGNDTGHGQQNAGSGAVGTSGAPATHVTKLPFGHRLPPGPEESGTGILPPTSTEGAGAPGGALACRTSSKAPGSLQLPALRDVRATITRTGTAALPAPVANQGNFWSRGQVVTTHPRERARAAGKNRRIRHQRVDGPGTTSVHVSRPAVTQRHTRGRKAPFPFSYTQVTFLLYGRGRPIRIAIPVSRANTSTGGDAPATKIKAHKKTVA